MNLDRDREGEGAAAATLDLLAAGAVEAGAVAESGETPGGAGATGAGARRPSLWARIWKLPVAVWKVLAGAACCQTLFLGLLAVGWTYRLVQRSVFAYWWRQRPMAAGASRKERRWGFEAFAAADPVTRGHTHWPNWFLRQGFRTGWREGRGWLALRLARSLFHSLWANLRTGFWGALATAVLTLPGGVMMYFSWYDGWNNSFNKGYEQAQVGPALGLAGIALFIAAMFYVPLGQARQATTGEWRSFFQFRVIWQVFRRRAVLFYGLALLYAAAALPVLVLRAYPMFIPQAHPWLMDAGPELQLEFLQAYYFWVAVFAIFPLYVILRLAAGRVYASGLLAAVREGAVPEAALGRAERNVLGRLGLLQPAPAPAPLPWFFRATGAAARGALFAGGSLALGLLWFGFVFQDFYIAQFLNYLPGPGWLNHPLVQVPWFNFVPEGLLE